MTETKDETLETEEKVLEEEETTEKIEEKEENKKEAEIEELNQRLLRIAADFDNFKRRSRTEKTNVLKYANESILSDLLPVLDNFQRALDVKEPSEEIKKFLDGMDMIHRQLTQVLNNAGLEPIEAKGSEFDPAKHEAVMQVEDDSVEDNVIVEDLRTGYIYKDKVIRPSMVKVAKNA